MAEKPQAIVTASFEILAKLAWHLEPLLRGLTAQVPCKVLQVTTEVKVDAEQTVQQDEPGPGLEQRASGIGAGIVRIVGGPDGGDAGEDGELAGTSGEGKPEPGGGDAAEGLDGSVLSQESRDVTSEADASTVDSGPREGTDGEFVIVAQE